MGQQIETLEDLLRRDLRALAVGINPAPRSVRAGHYYQGNLGQKFFARLLQARVVPAGRGGWQDDEAFAAGVGFTDIVKRPSERAPAVRREEFEHGKTLLLQKIDHFKPAVVIFTFKQTATKIFGGFAGNGFVPGLSLPGSEVFVMPGPYEKSDSVQKTLADLARHLA
jgi:TDG/mug DNA glycosylase family protein